MDAILAVNNGGFIGLDSKLPWRSSADFKHFREMTMGKTCLVGRVTYESMPKLHGRNLIVVGKGYNTLEEALKHDIDYVIGGKTLYRAVMHLVEDIHLSVINDWSLGDVGMPELHGYTGVIKRYYFEVD
jgi:dihydrofolate reductase